MDTARDLSDRLALLLRGERSALGDFLVALADFDRRQAWRALGYPSLFVYLNRHLELSNGASHYRAVAARLVQRHPAVLEALREGKLCFTVIVELSKVLTPENEAEVLPRLFHRSKAEAKAVSAELRPQPVPERVVVTAVPAPALARVVELAPATGKHRAEALHPVEVELAPPAPPLWLHLPGGARPHRPGGTRRALDGGKPEMRVREAQQGSRTAGVRRGVDAPVLPAGAVTAPRRAGASATPQAWPWGAVPAANGHRTSTRARPRNCAARVGADHAGPPPSRGDASAIPRPVSAPCPIARPSDRRAP
jgi:hypothetical protein